MNSKQAKVKCNFSILFFSIFLIRLFIWLYTSYSYQYLDMSYKSSSHIVYYEQEPKMFFFLSIVFLFLTIYLIYEIINFFVCKIKHKESLFLSNHNSDILNIYVCINCEEAYRINNFINHQRCINCDGELKSLDGFYDNWTDEQKDKRIFNNIEENNHNKQKVSLKKSFNDNKWWEID